MNETLETMKIQALKTLDKSNIFRSSWYERAYARGQLSILNVLEGSEHDIENTRRNTSTLH